ncbi:MAG: dihydrolipoamide acetyltransferase family protein [Verrucomicrobiales bacterium]|nr:dihydrolipoamide acetyltransferase family protein [Verrucomicrobiales bacterium]
MASYIEMPKLSDTMTEGVLLKWLKSEGERVEIGDVLAEVETDKATMEMEAFDEGVLGKIYVGAGEKVLIGTKLGVLVGEGEEVPAAVVAEVAVGEVAEVAEVEVVTGAPGTAVVAAGNSRRVKSSPLARKMAAELGVDLAGVAGTGPGGRVVKVDVLAAGRKPLPAVGGARVAEVVAARAAGDGDEIIPLSGMRAIIAERLLASKTQIPHFYLHSELDAGPMMRLRAQLNDTGSTGEEGNVYTVNDFVLKATVAAAVEVPEINSSFAGDHVVRYANVDLAVAVAVEDGLVTPVIRGAQGCSLLDISLAVKELAAKAREKRLKPDEMQDGTLTVSNLGSYGIDRFDAIINPPQAAILAIGAIVKKAVVEGDEIAVGLRMDIGLSCDHRVVDGAVGARYLQALTRYLEKPALMLV